jgi:hypothetical protein
VCDPGKVQRIEQVGLFDGLFDHPSLIPFKCLAPRTHAHQAAGAVSAGRRKQSMAVLVPPGQVHGTWTVVGILVVVY